MDNNSSKYLQTHGMHELMYLLTQSFGACSLVAMPMRERSPHQHSVMLIGTSLSAYDSLITTQSQ